MPIRYKTRDIVTMIQGGTNNSTRVIERGGFYLRGAPAGENPEKNWEDKPWDSADPFGITIGGKDLSCFYKAAYIDYYNTNNETYIPDGVNRVKVICIGGGGGGSGGNGGHRNTYRKRGNCSGSNMNRNWNWNSPYCNYYDAWEDPSNGNVGKCGSYGQYVKNEFNRDGVNTFQVQIGEGGGPGNGGRWQKGGVGTPGNSGGNGNATQFRMGSKSLVANGGAGGEGTTNNSFPNTINPAAVYNDGPNPPSQYIRTGGNAGNTSTDNGYSGGAGNRGFCRVYFLY
jgi:hypothetical protein